MDATEAGTIRHTFTGGVKEAVVEISKARLTPPNWKVPGCTVLLAGTCVIVVVPGEVTPANVIDVKPELTLTFEPVGVVNS